MMVPFSNIVGSSLCDFSDGKVFINNEISTTTKTTKDDAVDVDTILCVSRIFDAFILLPLNLIQKFQFLTLYFDVAFRQILPLFCTNFRSLSNIPAAIYTHYVLSYSLKIALI